MDLVALNISYYIYNACNLHRCRNISIAHGNKSRRVLVWPVSGRREVQVGHLEKQCLSSPVGSSEIEKPSVSLHYKKFGPKQHTDSADVLLNQRQ